MQSTKNLQLVVMGWDPSLQFMSFQNHNMLAQIIPRHDSIMLISPGLLSSIVKYENLSSSEKALFAKIKDEVFGCSASQIWGSEKYVWMYNTETNCTISIGFENLNVLNISSQQGSLQYKPKINRIFGHRILRIATGNAHTLMLTAQGQVLATGSGSNGELGVGKIPWSSELIGVKFPTENVSAEKEPCAWDISAGCSVSAVIWGHSRNLFTFGSGAYYRLGKFYLASKLSFDLTSNAKHTLGHGSDEDCMIPTLVKSLEGIGMLNVDGSSAGVAMVACGTWHMVAVAKGSSDVFTWGWNKFGQVKAASTAFEELRSPDALADHIDERYQRHSSVLGSFKDSTQSEIVRYPRRLKELDCESLVGDEGVVTAVTCGSKHTAILVRLATTCLSSRVVRVSSDQAIVDDSYLSCWLERVIVMGELGIGRSVGQPMQTDASTTAPRVVFDTARSPAMEYNSTVIPSTAAAAAADSLSVPPEVKDGSAASTMQIGHKDDPHFEVLTATPVCVEGFSTGLTKSNDRELGAGSVWVEKPAAEGGDCTATVPTAQLCGVEDSLTRAHKRRIATATDKLITQGNFPVPSPMPSRQEYNRYACYSWSIEPVTAIETETETSRATADRNIPNRQMGPIESKKTRAPPLGGACSTVADGCVQTISSGERQAYTSGEKRSTLARASAAAVTAPDEGATAAGASVELSSVVATESPSSGMDGIDHKSHLRVVSMTSSDWTLVLVVAS